MIKYTTTLKDKIMTLVSRFFRPGFSSTLLWCAALTMALLVPASTALAEPVTLSCQANAAQVPFTYTFRINYATGLVEQLGPSGAAYNNRIAPNATISPNTIVWSVKLLDTGLAKPVPMIWAGTIDRLSGTGWEEFSREPDWHIHRTSFTCQQAKQKF